MAIYKTKTQGDVELTISWQTISGAIEPVSFSIVSVEKKPLSPSVLYRELIPSLSTIVKNERAKISPRSTTTLIKKGRSQGRQLTREHLESVASIYQNAYAEGISVQKAVAAEMGISVSTASKRIMKARKVGMIKPRLHGTGVTR